MKVNNLKCTIMKKLNKLQINPEKLMKNEDLIALRGGETVPVWVRCGFCDNYQSQCFQANVDISNWDEVAAVLSALCYPNGVTFDISGCPPPCY
jgi:hypothetical protein